MWWTGLGLLRNWGFSDFSGQTRGIKTRQGLENSETHTQRAGVQPAAKTLMHQNKNGVPLSSCTKEHQKA